MLRCPLCGSLASKQWTLSHTSVWLCAGRQCRLQFAAPQLDDQYLDAEYRRCYYPDSQTSEVTLYGETPSETLQQVLGHFAKELGELAGRQLLDYGCGTGALCRVALQHGMQPVGIEADFIARQEVHRGGSFAVYRDLDELLASKPNARFDLITLWNVVEHLRRPWLDLKRLHGLLKPEGWLLLSTPNAISMKARLLGSRWDNYTNPTHFYYFTRRSLRSVLRWSSFSSIGESRLFIAYGHHRGFRRALQRALVSCKLDGQLLFVARG